MTNPALAPLAAARAAVLDARDNLAAASAAYNAARDDLAAALATMAALDAAAKAEGGDAARLIAAAPEMLAALKLAEKNMTASPAFNAWDLGPAPSLLAVRAAVRAAVRKAEGDA